MNFRYSKYREVTLSKDAYIFWNSITDCKVIHDKSIHYTGDGWVYSNYCDLSNRDFEYLKKNNLIREIKGPLLDKYYITSSGRKIEYFYWMFTAEALAMDITIYRPHIKRGDKGGMSK